MTNTLTAARPTMRTVTAAPIDRRPAVEALEQQFGLLFSQARARVRDQSIRVHPDLSPAGYNVLATLVRCGPQHAGSLAAMLYTDKSTISRIVKQLADLDLVERRPDPTDGRACYLAATTDATARVDAVRDSQRQKLREFLDGWDVADIQQLTSLLSRLNDEL